MSGAILDVIGAHPSETNLGISEENLLADSNQIPPKRDFGSWLRTHTCVMTCIRASEPQRHRLGIQEQDHTHRGRINPNATE